MIFTESDDKLRVGFALTGSFCTFSRVIPQMEKLVSSGIDVLPIMSEKSYSTDTRFGTSEEFVKRIRSITGKNVLHTQSVDASIGRGTVAYDKVSITNPGMGDWDHNINHPDLIIQFNWINDYHGVYKAGNATMDKMEENYYNLICHMLSVHPSAKLIIISHETIPDFNEMLDRVIEKYSQVGDASRIRVLKSTKSYARHPFASYQKEIAEELKPVVSELMGW